MEQIIGNKWTMLWKCIANTTWKRKHCGRHWHRAKTRGVGARSAPPPLCFSSIDRFQRCSQCVLSHLAFVMHFQSIYLQLYAPYNWRRHAAWHRRPLILGLGVFVLCFGKLCLQGNACRSFGWSCLILADVGRSWQILGDLGRSCQNLVFICRVKKKHSQTSVQKGYPKTTTNPFRKGVL